MGVEKKKHEIFLQELIQFTCDYCNFIIIFIRFSNEWRNGLTSTGNLAFTGRSQEKMLCFLAVAILIFN